MANQLKMAVICHSVANNNDVLSTNFGTAASIQAFLNNVIYNQAIVTWDVVKERIVTVNFDLNRDGLFDNSAIRQDILDFFVRNIVTLN